MNAAAHTANTTANTTASTARTPIAAGDVVFVLPGYSMETKSRTVHDDYDGLYMNVIRVCKNGDCLLDFTEDGEGEVFMSDTRLVRIE